MTAVVELDLKLEVPKAHWWPHKCLSGCLSIQANSFNELRNSIEFYGDNDERESYSITFTIFIEAIRELVIG